MNTSNRVPTAAPINKTSRMEVMTAPQNLPRPALPPISSLTEHPRYGERDSHWSAPQRLASSSRAPSGDYGGRGLPPLHDARDWHHHHPPRQDGAPGFPVGAAVQPHGPSPEEAADTEGRPFHGRGSPMLARLAPLAASGPDAIQLGKRPIKDEAGDAPHRSASRTQMRSPIRPGASPWPIEGVGTSDAYTREPPLSAQRRLGEKAEPTLLQPGDERSPWPRSGGMEDGSGPRRPGPPSARGPTFEPPGMASFGYPGGRPGGEAKDKPQPQLPPRDEEAALREKPSASWRDSQSQAYAYGPPYASDAPRPVKAERPEADSSAASQRGHRRMPSGGYLEGPPPAGPHLVSQASRSPIPPFSSPHHLDRGPPKSPAYAMGREVGAGANVPVAPPMMRPASTVGVVTLPGSVPAAPVSAPASTTAAATPSANRRVAHLLSEQRRRESINTGFEDLRQALPACRDGQDSKATVLRRAVEYIHELESIIQQSHRIRAESGGIGFDPHSPPHDHDNFGSHRHPGRPDDDPRRSSGGRGPSSHQHTAGSSFSDDRSVINGIPGHSYRREAPAGYGTPQIMGRPFHRAASPLADTTVSVRNVTFDGWVDADHMEEQYQFAQQRQRDRQPELSQALKRCNSDPEERETGRVRRKLSQPDEPSPSAASLDEEWQGVVTTAGPRSSSNYDLQRGGGAYTGSPTAIPKPDYGVRMRTGMGPGIEQHDQIDAGPRSAIPMRASDGIYFGRHPC
ncbi:hypothetical protein ACQY0O_002495 [Thecaphora frezii]